jgi:hypothetical protein
VSVRQFAYPHEREQRHSQRARPIHSIRQQIAWGYQDPYERLAVAFLVGYPANSARAYLSDLKAWGTYPPDPRTRRALSSRPSVTASCSGSITSSPVNLGSLDWYSGASGLNDRDQVVGYYTNTSDMSKRLAFVWNRGKLTPLDAVTPGSFAEAKAIRLTMVCGRTRNGLACRPRSRRT